METQRDESKVRCLKDFEGTLCPICSGELVPALKICDMHCAHCQVVWRTFWAEGLKLPEE